MSADIVELNEFEQPVGSLTLIIHLPTDLIIQGPGLFANSDTHTIECEFVITNLTRREIFYVIERLIKQERISTEKSIYRLVRRRNTTLRVDQLFSPGNFVNYNYRPGNFHLAIIPGFAKYLLPPIPSPLFLKDNTLVIFIKQYEPYPNGFGLTYLDRVYVNRTWTTGFFLDLYRKKYKNDRLIFVEEITNLRYEVTRLDLTFDNNEIITGDILILTEPKYVSQLFNYGDLSWLIKR